MNAVRNTARAAAGMAALALVISVTGVSPAEAVRAVKRALNADAVDGLSASRTPKPGHLLALDKAAKFPSSALPATGRGPRGPQGPAGARGDPGPAGPAGAAEVYVTRNNAGNDLPTTGTATIGELRVPAGSYSLDFSAHAYLTDTASTFVDCQMTTNGQQIVKTAALVGNAPEATIEANLVLTEAMTLTESTVIRVLCSQRSNTNVKLTDARLRAARATTVIVQ